MSEYMDFLNIVSEFENLCEDYGSIDGKGFDNAKEYRDNVNSCRKKITDIFRSKQDDNARLTAEVERLRKALEDIKSEIILEGEGVESTLYLMTDAALRGEE